MNSELLLKVAAAVAKEKGHHWDQESWGTYLDEPIDEQNDFNLCKTAFCVAGHALIQDGWRPVFEFYTSDYSDYDEWQFVGFKKGSSLRRGDEIPAKAQDLLGLTDNEAANLFDGDWLPRGKMTPQAALRGLARGKSVESVTNEEHFDSTVRRWWRY